MAILSRNNAKRSEQAPSASSSFHDRDSIEKRNKNLKDDDYDGSKVMTITPGGEHDTRERWRRVYGVV